MKTRHFVVIIVGTLFHSSEYRDRIDRIYPLKSQIRAKMEYCQCIWTGNAESFHSNIDKIKNLSLGLVSPSATSFPSDAKWQAVRYSISVFIADIEPSQGIISYA